MRTMKLSTENKLSVAIIFMVILAMIIGTGAGYAYATYVENKPVSDRILVEGKLIHKDSLVDWYACAGVNNTGYKVIAISPTGIEISFYVYDSFKGSAADQRDAIILNIIGECNE